MSPRSDSAEIDIGQREPVTLVDARALDELLGMAADAEARDVLETATRVVTRLLGERGSCIWLDGNPRVLLAPHAPGATDLPIDLARYPEIRAAAERREIVVIDDVHLDAELASVRDRLPADLRAVVVVPLIARDACVGVILVQSARPSLATETACATASVVARLATVLATRTRGLGIVQPRLPDLGTPAFGIVGGVIPTVEPPSRILIVEDDFATASALADSLRAEGYHTNCAADGADALKSAFDDVPDLVLLDVNLPGLDGFDTATCLRRSTRTRSVPIVFLSGIDDLSSRVRDVHLDPVDFIPKPFSLDELLARVQMALGQGRARQTLQRAADQDELTGLGNLRLLDRRLGAERARFARYGHPLSLVMIDVDKLKRINDERGHLAGSEALRAIARVLREQARDTDVVVRYGGDEFVVVLPHTGLADAATFCRRVAVEVAALRLDGLGLTVSVGVATLTRLKTRETTEELLARADRAAYRAKQAGGNRVCVDDQEPD
ncbi:MAG: domain/GGDEF domain protein [Myxococcales bacterium]|nr:domain/GGDEF domain protein [Myxococcales bacterium]